MVSGLSIGAKVSLMSAFNSHSLIGKEPDKGLLSILPYDIANAIEEDVYKSNYQKVLNEGMGINDNGSISMKLFSYRKFKHFIDSDKTISYIDNTCGSLWDVFNYDGFIRGMTILKVYNETKNKDEKMYLLMLLGMCNIGYCNNKNPFGEREQSGGWISLQVKNYDLQYRMYQISAQKYYQIPEDITEQLQSVKPKKMEKYYTSNSLPTHYNHFMDETRFFDNKVILKGCYNLHSHYTKKIKCKYVRLCKGKFYQCDDISNWFRNLCRYTIDEKNRLYYSDACRYKDDKKVLRDYFRSFPYDPSYFSSDIDLPIDQY